MSHILIEACEWLVLMTEFIVVTLMISFLFFGGKFTVSVQLKGPLRFMSTREDDSYRSWTKRPIMTSEIKQTPPPPARTK